MKKKILKIFLLLIILILIFSFYYFNLKDYLTLETLKRSKFLLDYFYRTNPIKLILIYLVIYITATSFSLPGAAILTLSGGAVFGFLTGTIIVSFASTIGATIAFLISRFLLGSIVQKKYSEKLKAINKGIEKEGYFYLFALRLIPVFPFFIINLTMGLTKMRPLVFFITSQIGMLPGTMAYVFAGTEIGKISSLNDILSAKLILSFVIIAAMPFILKKAIYFFKCNKVGEEKRKGCKK